jgi:hypothetical protein
MCVFQNKEGSEQKLCKGGQLYLCGVHSKVKLCLGLHFY